jgi:hypothetical protein
VTTAIIVLVALAVFHFVYESILAPSFRLSLRFRLFVLRDEVRQLKIECVRSLNDEHFVFLQDSINGLISILHRFDMASLFGVEFESRKDPEFLKQAEARSRMLDDCKIPRVREIGNQALKIAAEALFVNSGAWVVLFFGPWVVALIGYSEAKKRIRIFASLTGQDFKRISPPDSAAVAPI